MATHIPKTPRAPQASQAPRATLTPAPGAARPPPAVERFLHGIRTGDWTTYAEVLTADAYYDASVPGWRYQYQGPADIVEEMKQEWTGRNLWEVREQHVTLAGDTVVLDFEIHGTRAGHGHPHRPEEVTCRIANVFRLRDGRIAEHRYYCCGEWSEEIMRRIEAEAPRVRRSGAAR